MLFEELRDVDESHVLIALDEIDNIGESDTILYKLPRANNDNGGGDNYVNPDNTKIGVIGITNDGDYRNHIDPRAQSTLGDEEIHFPEYNASQLEMILEDRARTAFKDGALSAGVIPLVAALSAQRSGYARTALDLLYKAGDLTSRENSAVVTENHVREAEDRIQQGAIVTKVDSLSPQATLITYSLLRLHEEDETPAKIDKVHAWYKKYTKMLDKDPVTSRTVHNILNNLIMKSIATSREINRGRSGGRHYEYDLGVGKELVVG